MYKNYHKHDHQGNPWAMDVVVKPEEYCKRAIELGHDSVFTVNHGVTGNIFDWMEQAKKYNLKLHYGTEAYYVPDRFEKDRSNRHIIIIAKNNEGVMQLNDIMTEAHQTGFYYKPRIDKELLFSLNSKNFIITTACVAGLWNDPELILALHRKFGDNFFLELQDHNIAIQKEVNRRMLQFSKQAHIPIIHANDSHYIYPQDSKYRDILLKAKGIFYEEEESMTLDYPSEDEIYSRYEKQGILTPQQVRTALDNTMVFDECEPITIINDDIKLPPISEHPTEDLRNLIYTQWETEKQNIPKEQWTTYEEAISYELDIVEKTHMENYFLIDYNVAKNGQEKYGGKLTNTGRGSAPSFYITKLLGLTDIDRVAAPITLFPTRFMSVERILGSRSLPDIDLNMADREPFIKATEDLLGKENCAWMLTWKPLQNSSAFRTYCKGIGKDISEYDEIAKNLELYENDKKWKDIIEESKRFRGVIESVSESPCSMLLYYKPVRKELGLVRTNAGVYCCLLDGINCDKYKYLKNDYLAVTVWSIIRSVCELAGIPIPTIRELDKLLDDETFDIYKEGLTCTINQADSDFATALVKRYCPQSVSEMSAFVAIIRPGCASLLQDFIDRKPYTTGVKELDDILTEGKHRMIYQELIMRYLIWLGIPETGSYDIIKKIAKKKFKEAELAELKTKLLNGWKQRLNTTDGFDETWQVVQNAAKYSFNASHSLSYAYDSLYGAYLKSHYPLEYYTVALNYYGGDSERTLKLTNELPYFDIKLKPIRFRYSKGDYTLSREDNSIYKGIQSIKNMNTKIADEIYELRSNQYSSFLDLLFDIKEKTSTNARKLKILIELDFFSEFGDVNYLLEQYAFFDKFYGKKQFKKDILNEFGVSLETISKYSEKESPKMFSEVDFHAYAQVVAPEIRYTPRKLSEQIKAQTDYLGYITIIDNRYTGMAAVVSIDTKYSPKVKMYSLKNGTTLDCKIDKRTFNQNPISAGDIVTIYGTKKKPKARKNAEGKWENVPGTSELWITKYVKAQNL
ncbi:PHP domain-containing protein [Ruminococcus sp. YE282]|uniref:PHP domain-containing protein n=1 Tax=Ruminococcus sp. YE282 TaxID=3158780 RepID=UPI00087E5C40|nr:DNA polymerase III, alpha subunit [Ruminococcus bromii]